MKDDLSDIIDNNLNNIQYIIDPTNNNNNIYKEYYNDRAIDTNLIHEKIENFKNAKSLSSIFNKINRGTIPTQNIMDVTRWSPQSNAGLVYEWNRGVIAISTDGTVIKENLDGTSNHHADATVRVSNQLGIPLNPTDQPYLAGCIASSNNLVIFQSEGDNALFYLPESISEEQAQAIEEIAAPRSNFTFSIAYMEVPYDNLSYDNLMRFVQEKTRKLGMAV